jgi:hypothetical protein
MPGSGPQMATGYPIVTIAVGLILAYVVATFAAGLLANRGFPLPPEERRIGCIDGLRGYLALSVFAHHFIKWIQVIRFPGDHLGLAILGHPWKPAWLLIFCRSAARAAQRAEMTSSSVSRSGMCLLTIGSSTSVQSVSAGCTLGV